MKITIDTKDLDKLCMVCFKVSDTVKDRRYTTKNYTGPCGDSFCYASCDSTSCRPIYARACLNCETNRRRPKGD